MRIGEKSWIIAVAALLTVSASARADEPKTEGTGFAAALQAGFATGDSDTGVTLGGSVLYDVVPRLSVEASGAYLARGRGESGATGTVSLLLNLRPAAEKVVPYLAVGGGVYHTSFDGPGGMDGWRFDGRGGRDGWSMGNMPAGFVMPPGFEGGRLAGWREALSAIVAACGPRGGGTGCPVPGGGGPWGSRGSSTDGAVTIGGGIRIDLGHGLFLRPDLRAIVVFGDDTRTLGVLNVGVGYRF